jgi:hypothetical protein
MTIPGHGSLFATSSTILPAYELARASWVPGAAGPLRTPTLGGSWAYLPGAWKLTPHPH